MSSKGSSPNIAPRWSPRRLLRFSLRWLLLLVTLAAIALAYPASIVRQAAREREIVAQWPRKHDRVWVSWKPSGPKWLRNIVGEDRCRVVQKVVFNGGFVPRGLERMREFSVLEELTILSCDLGDAHIERLGVLPHVKHLNFSRTSLTDRAVQTLARYPALMECNLTQTQVSPAGVQDLNAHLDCSKPGMPRMADCEMAAIGGYELVAPETSGLNFRAPDPNPEQRWFDMLGNVYTDAELARLEVPDSLQLVERVSLTGTYISAAGIQRIAALPRLRQLSLRNNRQVDDACLAALAGQPTLAELELEEGNITAAGIKHLQALPRLRVLRVRGPGIRNEAVRQIGQCQHLEILNLHSANITSDVLPVLGQMKSLQQLSLGGTNVSNRRLEELTKLTNLERLNLSGTFVNPHGASQLTSLTSLQLLELGGAYGRFSDVQRTELRAALPRCQLRFNTW